MEKYNDVIDFADLKKRKQEEEIRSIENEMKNEVMATYYLGGVEALEELVRSMAEYFEASGNSRVAGVWIMLRNIRSWLDKDTADKLMDALQDVIGTQNIIKSVRYSPEEIDRATAVYRAAMRGEIQIEDCKSNERQYVLNNIAIYAGAMDRDVFAVQKQTPIGYEYGMMVIKDPTRLKTTKNAIAFILRFSDDLRIRSAVSEDGTPVIIYEFHAEMESSKPEKGDCIKNR